MKLELKLRRQVLINTGNYTNCIADVELKAVDITPSEYSEKYDILSDLLSHTVPIEVARVLEVQNVVNTMKPDAVVQMVEKSEEGRKKAMKVLAENL